MTAKLLLDSRKTIVLIDASYYVFYRYFATMRWFTFQKKEFDISTIVENKEFVSNFLKHLDSDIKKICKKWKTDVKNIVFCADCQRCNIWRIDIYPEYKASRAQNANFNGNIFNVFTEHIQKQGLVKISFDRLEADDVIYLTQSKLKHLTKCNIVIITNDNDYLQLADSSVSIYNMQFKDITQRGTKNAKADLYYKALYGDKSDNIQKIASFLTKEKAQQISMLDDKQLIQWLNNNLLLEKFNFNMNLISFERIPVDYVKRFYANISISMDKLT